MDYLYLIYHEDEATEKTPIQHTWWWPGQKIPTPPLPKQTCVRVVLQHTSKSSLLSVHWNPWSSAPWTWSLIMYLIWYSATPRPKPMLHRAMDLCPHGYWLMWQQFAISYSMEQKAHVSSCCSLIFILPILILLSFNQLHFHSNKYSFMGYRISDFRTFKPYLHLYCANMWVRL